jgi:adenosylcobinamide kinase/adenosylcobinamide-phosphate guanylyltransferase
VIADISDGDIVVVDCLTLWLSNWLCGEQPDGWNEEKSAFFQSLERTEAHIILVSNETGMGVVPMGELSRKFVDESGWLHQEIAAHADRVIMMMLGIPQLLKP